MVYVTVVGVLVVSDAVTVTVSPPRLGRRFKAAAKSASVVTSSFSNSVVKRK